MSGFQSPNYTQTPNDLFDELLPEMGLAELKVVMCIVRHTFGYHKEKVSLSLRAIARFTGLTANSVMEGAIQAEEHGLIVRHQDGNKTTVWEAVVSVVPTTTRRISRYDTSVLPAATQLGVKESKEKENKEDLFFNAIIESGQKAQAETNALIAFEEAFKIENGNIPWFKTKPEWTRLRKKLVERYQSDPEYFKKYRKWYEEAGKFGGGMNVQQLRRDPEGFILALNIFESATTPSTPPAGGSSVEETRKKIESEDWRKRS